jgi:hypothetical protein
MDKAKAGQEIEHRMSFRKIVLIIQIERDKTSDDRAQKHGREKPDESVLEERSGAGGTLEGIADHKTRNNEKELNPISPVRKEAPKKIPIGITTVFGMVPEERKMVQHDVGTCQEPDTIQ